MEISSASHAFITGGASGIGLAIGRALAARGVAVTLADIDGEAVRAAAAALGARALGLVLDVRDRGGWADAKQAAEAEFGPVDILVNNAGIAPDGTQLSDMAPESYDRMIGIAQIGVFNGIHAFGASIRSLGRGHVVNTASMAGLVAENPGLGAYGAAKAAVVAMSEVLRVEMAPHGVGVSVLCPGLVATNLATTTEKVTGIVRGGDNSIMARGMDADAVAGMVLAAIAANELYIMTHRKHTEGLRARLAAILAAFEQG